MKLIDFYRNIGDFSYSEWRDGTYAYVRFRIYSALFFDSFLELGFRVSEVHAGFAGLLGFYEIVMDFTEFEKLLKSLIGK